MNVTPLARGRLTALVMAPVALILSLSLAGCGAEEESRRSAGASGEANSEGVPSLAQPSEQVLSTLVIPFGDESMSLTDANQGVVRWVVDMEDAKKVEAGVAPDKYLRLKGELTVPLKAENRPYDVGCLYVEMKDNVYYREKTWLRLATRNGITGKTYTEVELPLTVDFGGWKSVPSLDGSITLQEFAGNTIKKFDGSLCFRLDFSVAPAQLYGGELIVQYLRPGDGDNPPRCDLEPTAAGCEPSNGGGAVDGDDEGEDPIDSVPPPVAFACQTAPTVLKAGQEVELTWAGIGTSTLEVKLAADPASFTGSLGEIVAKGGGKVLYKAPAKVATNVRIIATGRALGVEALPAFCEVRLMADEEIVIPDDGETNGLTCNVYKLPSSTTKLPDFDKLTAVDRVVTPNVDIPERSFDKGFPGVKDLVEWFGIRLRGQLLMPAAQTCSFKLISDDGAILSIDGKQVVNNDGVHYTATQMGNATLAAGSHDFRVDYFQGPRYHITLQLLWKCGNATAYTIIPPASFARPLN